MYVSLNLGPSSTSPPLPCQIDMTRSFFLRVCVWKRGHEQGTAQRSKEIVEQKRCRVKYRCRWLSTLFYHSSRRRRRWPNQPPIISIGTGSFPKNNNSISRQRGQAGIASPWLGCCLPSRRVGEGAVNSHCRPPSRSHSGSYRAWPSPRRGRAASRSWPSISRRGLCRLGLI